MVGYELQDSAPLFEGDLAEFSVPDVLQIIAASGKPQRLALERNGAFLGEIVLSRGDVLGARSATRHASPAFAELLEITQGSFRVFRAEHSTPGDAWRIDRSLQSVLIESLQRAALEEDFVEVDDVDEWEEEGAGKHEAVRIPPALPTVRAMSSVSESKGADRRFAVLRQQATTAQTSGELDRAIAILEACLAVRPDDTEILSELTRLGVVVTAGPPSPVSR